MKKLILLAALCVSALSQAQLYSRIVETGSRYNPAAAGATTSDIIVFDDVNIASSLNPLNQPLRITNVTLGVRRAADAPAITATAYWATGDFSTATMGPANLIGSQALALRAGTGFVTELVSFNTNFVVTPNFTANAGYGQFFIGLNLSNNITSAAGTATPSGWRITSGNGFSEDRFLQRDSTGVTGPWWFGGAPANPPGSFYITLQGQPVPEPGSMVALGLGAAALLRRRRKA